MPVTGMTRWVGIDGPGAAGKTSLAGLVVGRVPAVDVVHIDDFARPTVPGWERQRFVEQVVRPLVDGRPARYQIWSWDSDSPGEWVGLEPGRILVAEGVSSTAAELGVPWSLRIWVDAPREVRLARALARDGVALLPRWLDDWMPSEDAYIAAERPDQRADLVVDGTVIDGAVRRP